jgi:excisionase family DNA binding protein
MLHLNTIPMAWPGADVLRQAREAAGLTPTALATRARLIPNTVFQLEAGRANPHYRTLAALANVLGINLAALLLGEAALLALPSAGPYALCWGGYERVRDARTRQGMTLETLHEATGLGRDVLRSMEKGPTAVSYQTLVRLAHGLNLPLLTLIPELSEAPAPAKCTAGEMVLWTIAEAVERTGVSADHLYKLIGRGQVTSQRQGKMRLVEAAGLQAWLAEHRHDRRGRCRAIAAAGGAVAVAA